MLTGRTYRDTIHHYESSNWGSDSDALCVRHTNMTTKYGITRARPFFDVRARRLCCPVLLRPVNTVTEAQLACPMTKVRYPGYQNGLTELLIPREYKEMGMLSAMHSSCRNPVNVD